MDLIYNSKNTSEFETIIDNIINHNYNFHKISENARKIVEKLSWEKISDQYIDLYERLNEN